MNELMNFVRSFYSNTLFFHNWKHIEYGLNEIQKLESVGISISSIQKAAWLFHDAIYNPESNTNEIDSANLFLSFNKEHQIFNKEDENTVKQIILDTMKHIPTIKESEIVLDIDMASLAFSYDDFLKHRYFVIQEYKPFYNEEDLYNGTIAFINEAEKSDAIFYSSYYKHLNTLAFKNIQLFKDEVINKDFIKKSINNSLYNNNREGSL